MKIIFLGPQGSGKSTQAKMLSEHLNVPYIEMGQMLRDKMTDNTQDAQDIKVAMESGNLVDNEITIRALTERLTKPDAKDGFVLDGYPRNQEQLDKFPIEVDKVIYVKVPDEEAISRLSKRARADDTPEAIQKRLEIYHNETEPLLEQFRQKGLLTEVDGKPNIDDVKKALLNLF
ncbi:MAG TPA: nucleoside monophosphate kinase [Candidatus Saccharimonadales bacterium]|nr:nucleoside monophosphate kinase [Candidatus Saccharimonadales bacterium]